jgi:large subunit ribosomal protein L10
VNKTEKATVVEQLVVDIREADAIFAVDYRGISVAGAAALRGKLREADTRFRVVKNTLTERAADEAGVEALRPMLSGPTALAFVRGDAALAAKALNDVARETNLLEFKGGLMNGDVLSPDDMRAIARLPAREVLYGQLVGLAASPITGLARAMGSMISGLAIALGAIRDEGKVGGDAPAAEEAPAEEAPAAEAEAAPAAEAEAPAEEAPAEEAPATETETETEASADSGDDADKTENTEEDN